MKFLFVTPALGVGGVERWFLTLARHLRIVRPQGVVLTGGGIHPQVLHEVESICPVHYCGDSLQAQLGTMWRESKNCDLILTWGFQPNLKVLTDGLNLPVVVVSHNCQGQNPYLAANAACATHCVGVSQTAAQAFPAQYQAEVIENGSDVERSAPTAGARERLRQEWGVGDRTVVLYLGRMAGEKRPDLLLSALYELGDSYAGVVCGGGPLEVKVWEIAQRTPNQILLGSADLRPADLLAACDVAALPSLYEAFPLVLLEAWFARRPVAATPFKTAVDLQSRYGDVLFLSENLHTPQTFAAAIRKAAMDDGTVVQRAWDVAWEHYTATAMCRRWDEFFLRAVSAYHSGRMSGSRMRVISKTEKEAVTP
jgi:glycosyltransferase involved in cell wall biosynthesis